MAKLSRSLCFATTITANHRAFAFCTKLKDCQVYRTISSNWRQAYDYTVKVCLVCLGLGLYIGSEKGLVRACIGLATLP